MTAKAAHILFQQDHNKKENHNEIYGIDEYSQ